MHVHLRHTYVTRRYNFSLKVPAIMSRRKTVKIPEVVITEPVKVDGKEAAFDNPVMWQPLQDPRFLQVPEVS